MQIIFMLEGKESEFSVAQVRFIETVFPAIFPL